MTVKSNAKSNRRYKKRRPKYGRIFLSLLFFGLLVYSAVRFGLNVFLKHHETYMVDYGILDIKDDFHALILRNEIIVSTELKGSVTYYAEEGEIVVKGEPIAEIFNDGNTAAETSDAEPNTADEATDAPLAEVSTNKDDIEFDYTVLEYDIMTLKDQIVYAMEEENYYDIPTLKENLILKLEMREKLEGENKFLSNRTSSYSEQTIGQGRLSLGEKRTLYAPAEGILTYQLDGYEDELTIDNIYNLNYDELSNISANLISYQTDRVTSDTPLFKLVDQSTYYLLISVATEDAETYKQINSVSVLVDDQTMTGEVYDVFSNGDTAVAVIRMTENSDALYDKRWLDCTVIRNNFKGLKVHVDSIVTQDDQIGVYRVLDTGKLQFYPVSIIGYDDDYAIIQSDQFYDDTLGIVKSITADQEIVRNADQYQDGDYID